MGRGGAAVANTLILAVLVGAGVVESVWPDIYYQQLQEDQALEWLTFWCFIMAAGVFGGAGVRQLRGGKVPWFLVGLGLFCFVVAMEEISWGQRVLGFRPPEYFLQKNFQQELNVHNLASTSLRKGALVAILLGYGVLFPLVDLAAPVKRWFARLALVPPPVALVVSFGACAVLYLWYPWKFTGEVVEAGMSLSFMCTAFANHRELSVENKRPLVATLVTAAVCVGFLGVGSAFGSERIQVAEPEKERDAQVEVEALKQDVLNLARQLKKVPTQCGMHKRLFTFIEQHEKASPLLGATFPVLAGERGEFFIDPWNSPYWIRDSCDRATRHRVIFVYSFGPNRRRDSTHWEIVADDVGAYLRQ